MDHAVSRLLAHERIRAARHHIERTDEVTLARQAALSAIPAPTGAEGRRAAHLAELFREIGLSDVSIDHAGNVKDGSRGTGTRPLGRSSWPRISTPCSGPRWTSPSSAAASGSRARAFPTTPAA